MPLINHLDMGSWQSSADSSSHVNRGARMHGRASPSVGRTGYRKRRSNMMNHKRKMRIMLPSHGSLVMNDSLFHFCHSRHSMTHLRDASSTRSHGLRARAANKNSRFPAAFLLINQFIVSYSDFPPLRLERIPSNQLVSRCCVMTLADPTAHQNSRYSDV